jgi:O-antigen ligase
VTAFAWALCFVGIPVGLGFTLPKLCILVLAVWRQAWDGAWLPRRYWRPLAACSVALLLSTLTSVDRAMSLGGRFDSWAYGVLSCCLYAAVFALSAKSPPSRRGLAWLAVALSVHAVLQQFGLDPIMGAATNLPAGRSISYIGFPPDLGAVLAMLFFCCEDWWQELLVLVGLWCAGARGAALAVGFGFMAGLLPKRAGLIAASSALLVLLPAHAVKDLARREVWWGAWDVFIHRPLLGSGPDTFIHVFTGQHLAAMQGLLRPMATQAQAHNDLLQALATTGVVGTAAYLWLLWEIPWTPALVALFVCMKFDPMGVEVLSLGAMLAGAAVAEDRAWEGLP